VLDRLPAAVLRSAASHQRIAPQDSRASNPQIAATADPRSEINRHKVHEPTQRSRWRRTVTKVQP
jgi:hypothetical protein